MAPIRISLIFVLLLSGFVALGTTRSTEAVCPYACVKDVYMTCCNKKDQIPTCACSCAPPDGKDCAVHLANGTTIQCPKPKS